MKEREKDYYMALKPLVKVAMDLRYHREVLGTENILDVPAIYAANHTQIVDSFLMTLAYSEHTGEPMRMVTKQEYFDGRGVDNKGKLGRTARLFVNLTHQIPVVRDGATRADLKNFSDMIAETMDVYGESVGIHPEGTRVTDDRLYSFRAGLAWVALSQSRIVVPTGITYEEEVPGVRKAVVKFGEPIDAAEYSKRLRFKLMPTADKVTHLTERIEEQVADLTGFKRVGEFADIYSKPANG